MKRMVSFGGVGVLVLALTGSTVLGMPMSSTKTASMSFDGSAKSALSSDEDAVSTITGKKGKKKPVKKSGKHKKNKKHHRKHHRRHHHHRRDHDRDRDRGWHHDRDRYHRDWPHFSFWGNQSNVQFVSTSIAVVDDEDEEIEGDFGLIITDLDEDGPAAKAGLDIDDTIISINGVRVQTLEQLNTALKNIKGTVVVVFISDESEEVEEEDITPKAGKIGATLEVVELEDAE